MAKKTKAPDTDPALKALLSKWNAIHDDWEANVTYIWGRRSFHRMMDVVMHSVLKFNFQGRPVTRGWVEAIIAGDTKCGKSEVSEKLSAFLGSAKPIVCEAASFAGLVGGVSDVGGKKSINWGALPRLDRRAAVIDELTGLTTEQISAMSGLRSSGVAAIVKIEAEKSMARVRKLFLSNPRTDRNRRVSTYPFGVLVFPEIIGRAEDISRFDVALVASSDEVPLEVLNAKVRKTVKHTYTSEAAKALLYWAWTRTPEQVQFGRGVEDLVLDEALAMCRKYSSQIPLVEPGEQRYRVARMAVSLAARFHSTDKGGQRVLVKKEHVKLASYFMQECFDNPTTGYRAFSDSKRESEGSIRPAEVETILASLAKHPNLDVILDGITFSDDFSRMLTVEYAKQPQLLSDLVRAQLLEYGGDGKLYKTKKFVEFYQLARSKVSYGSPAIAF